MDHEYRNFRPSTRTAHYPRRSIFAIKGKNFQQITVLVLDKVAVLDEVVPDKAVLGEVAVQVDSAG